MANLTRAAKTVPAVSAVMLASGMSLETLEAWLDHLTAADAERNPLADVYSATTEVELVMSPDGSGGSDCRAGLGEAAVCDRTTGRR
jgi:hypothetical protein